MQLFWVENIVNSEAKSRMNMVIEFPVLLKDVESWKELHFCLYNERNKSLAHDKFINFHESIGRIEITR